jgi:Ni,Fe-hydrogenase I cytochrome b subunit
MDERIKEHLKYLNKYYLLLLESSKLPYDKFINNPIHQASTERFLHLAIESCLNDFKLFQQKVVEYLNKNKLPQNET